MEHPRLVKEPTIKTCGPSSGMESGSLRKQVKTPQVVEIEQQPTEVFLLGLKEKIERKEKREGNGSLPNQMP
jgi:hypothetical protein